MSNGDTRAGRLIGVAVLWVSSGTAAAQPSEAEVQPIPLPLDRTISSSHTASERFVYGFDAAAGADYLLIVDQSGLDLIVTVEAPDGAATSYNSPLFRDERELVLLEDTLPGRYLVSLHSEEHTGAVGGHSIRAAKLQGTPENELEAWRAMSRAAALNFESGDEAWRAGAEAYASAAARWRAAGATRELAQALFAAGALEYWQLYDWTRSAEHAAEAAALYEGLGEAALAANAVHLQAAALVERALEATDSSEAAGGPAAQALFDEAFALLERARQVHERLGNVYDLGLVLNNFGYTYYARGELEPAREYWQQAAAVMRSASEWTGELNPVSNLAVLDAEAGNVANAIDSFQRVLDILPAGTRERYRADTLDNLGLSHIMMGDLERALEVLASALAIQRKIEDLQGRGRSLRGIGRAYYALGELDLAKIYLRDGLAAARDTNDGRNQEAILRDLGNIAYLEKDYQAALDLHRQALDVVQSAWDEAYLELLVAKDLTALGRYEEAAELAAGVLADAESRSSELLLAEALHRLGAARLHLPNAAGAVEPLERAAAIYERLNLQAQNAEVLHSLALAARAEGNLERALVYGEVALDRLERLRLRVASPELRAFFSSVRRDYYESQIALLMALRSRDGDEEYAEAALDVSERARARMIADLLQEASLDLRFEAGAELEQRQAGLYDRLAERVRERERLIEGSAEDVDDARLNDVLADIASIENELNLLEIELREASPEFESLSPAEPLRTERMQALLDPETVLLQYAFAEGRAYVWVVSRDAVAAVDLGDQAAIEAAARPVLESLKTFSPDRAARAAFEERLAGLADLLLAPIAERLGGSRLVLSLDGVLQYVPFAALPIERADGSRQRLIERYALVHVPSMSALSALRRRSDGEPAPKTLAVFADPVLRGDDPRLQDRSSLTASLAPGDTDAGRTAAGANLERLPSTAHEADAIAALVAEDQRFVARGFAASRDTVLGTDLGQYRYLHFATHGLVDSRHPALSALAMSRFDETGARRDGLLRLSDIYGLRLNADLVVLSACETALGRDILGEGLLGLSQGFLYAGARSLIASLWQVSDRATSELMTTFYALMLDGGLPPAEALRSAQLAVAGERRWADPYFWAGFVLLGDWQ